MLDAFLFSDIGLFVIFSICVGAQGSEGVGVGGERPGLEPLAMNWRRRARRPTGTRWQLGDREQ